MTSLIKTVNLQRIKNAENFLSNYLNPTPLVKNVWLSNRLDCEIYLKLENMQPIGSFKIRGATFKISQLTADERARGVICASAGNHAQGVAWGSRELKTKATIVMPKTAPLMKVQNTLALGANVIQFGSGYDEAYAEAVRISQEKSLTYVHAFEDADVIAGQGVAGLEILNQLPNVQVIVGAIGGGGLIAGIGTAVKAIQPEVAIVGCQASGASSMVRSIRVKSLQKSSPANTFADGIAVARPSDAMFELLSSLVDEVIESDDEEIAAGVLTLIEKAKVIAEGAGALPIAVLEKIKPFIRGKRVVVVIGGGNIDVNVVGRIIERGLIRSGRRIRVNVLISDRPGSLLRLTQLLADQGANILQAIHDRDEPHTRIDQTEVALTIETRGPDHSDQVIEALKNHALRIVIKD